VNGDKVRDVRFFGGSYDAGQVDDLLRRIAAELDAGRPAGPLIASARFRIHRNLARGYDYEAVDWFLDQLRQEADPEPGGMHTDAWRDLPVADYFTRPATGGLGEDTGEAGSREHGSGTRKDNKSLLQECKDAWRDFGQQPGTHLRWVPTGIMRRELRTGEQQTIASVRTSASVQLGPLATVSTGGRTFTWERVTWSKRPDIADVFGRSGREGESRRYAAGREQAQAGNPEGGVATPTIVDPGELLDETGTPILYTSGMNFDLHAGAVLMFPDQRRLRFPVRGTQRNVAIMTAVDQAGNRVARYRFARTGFRPPVEIAVHPDQQLTEELALAIAVSVPWFGSYFKHPGGEGGG
jgi:DivIVA domain-containing protein